MNKILICIFSLAALLLSTSSAFAAPPMGPPMGPPCWPPPCVPIDGGISFLLAAGLAYGGKKLYTAHKDNQKKKEVSA